MARSTATLARPSWQTLFPSTLRLARWRLRQVWRLLFGTGLGIVAAVMLVCAVPMFSHVTTTAGLRGAFATPDSKNITISATTADMQPDAIHDIGTQIDLSVRTSLTHALNAGNQFSTQMPIFPVESTTTGKTPHTVDAAKIQLIGYDEQQVASHVIIITGRLPHSGAMPPEIVLTQNAADALGATVGSTVLLNSADTPSQATPADMVPFTLVGIVAIDNTDPFFHHQYFEPQRIDPQFPPIICKGIATNADLLQFLQRPAFVGPIRTQTQFFWYYTVNPALLDADRLDTLIAQANALQVELPNTLLGMDASPNGIVSGDAFVTLTDYQSRISSLQVPIAFLLIAILALVLYFVSVMTEILVDRQSDAIAVLRSRGVSRPQIFGALVTQSLGLGLIALAVGPLLALGAVLLIIRLALATKYQGTVELLTAHPLQTAYALPWFVFVVLGAMLIAINRATDANMLATRREAARTTRRPLWQRLNLDVVAAVIALTGYVISSLILNRASPDAQAQLNFLGLIAPTFIVLAGTLIFFRLYPLLLHLGARLAGRGKGAVPMLAMAQMSRSPRQSMRTTLLLAFAAAFMLFTIVYVNSQTQHLRDVASFNAGADFSGALNISPSQVTNSDDLMRQYGQIPGVTSVALGYSVTLPQNAGITNQQLSAVDADHYAQTATWDAHNSTQSLSSLMALFVSHRTDAANHGSVPAILNGTLWDALHLRPGNHFELLVPGYDYGRIDFVALARIDHIQGIYDATQFSSGGVLVDYQSLARVIGRDPVAQVPQPNYIWLRTASDAASLASVRHALTTGKLQLASLNDRRAMAQDLINDPLQIDLSGLLTVGAVASILLALVGVLTASWLSARSRLTNFAVLRALGTSPAQITSLLIWEQAITYGVAFVLGGLLALALADLLLPMLAYANAHTANGNELIGSVNLPAIQPLVPAGPMSLAVGALVAICLGALVLMTWVVARPSVSSTLRLNED